jgi:hypothetical protein
MAFSFPGRIEAAGNHPMLKKNTFFLILRIMFTNMQLHLGTINDLIL